MKIGSVLAFVGLAISFALPAFAQESKTPDTLPDTTIYKLTVVRPSHGVPLSRSELIRPYSSDDTASRSKGQNAPSSEPYFVSQIYPFWFAGLFFKFPLTMPGKEPSLADIISQKSQTTPPPINEQSSAQFQSETVPYEALTSNVLDGYPKILGVPVAALVAFGTISNLQAFIGTDDLLGFGLDSNKQDLRPHLVKATREEVATLGDISKVQVRLRDLDDFANVFNESGIFGAAQKRPSVTIQIPPTPIPQLVASPPPTPKEKKRDHCNPEGEICFHTDGAVSLTVTNPCTGVGIEVGTNSASLVYRGINVVSVAINLQFLINTADQVSIPIEDPKKSLLGQ